MDAASRDLNITDIRVCLHCLAFKLVSMNRGKVFGRLAGGKANPAEDRARAASSRGVQFSFCLFNPGKMMLVPDSSQPGQTRGICGSMNALTSLRHRNENQGAKNSSINLRPS